MSFAGILIAGYLEVCMNWIAVEEKIPIEHEFPIAA